MRMLRGPWTEYWTGQQLPAAEAVNEKNLGKHIGYVHAVDTDGELSRGDSAHTSTHLPLGEGILDLDAIIDALWPYAGSLPYWSLDFYACRDAEHTGIKSLNILRDKVKNV